MNQHHNTCDQCETVAHCMRHGCVPAVPMSFMPAVKRAALTCGSCGAAITNKPTEGEGLPCGH